MERLDLKKHKLFVSAILKKVGGPCFYTKTFTHSVNRLPQSMRLEGLRTTVGHQQISITLPPSSNSNKTPRWKEHSLIPIPNSSNGNIEKMEVREFFPPCDVLFVIRNGKNNNYIVKVTSAEASDADPYKGTCIIGPDMNRFFDDNPNLQTGDTLTFSRYENTILRISNLPAKKLRIGNGEVDTISNFGQEVFTIEARAYEVDVEPADSGLLTS